MSIFRGWLALRRDQHRARQSLREGSASLCPPRGGSGRVAVRPSRPLAAELLECRTLLAGGLGLQPLAARAGTSPPGVVGPVPTDSGQWWQFRGDRQLTGRTELSGNIETPEVLWSHFVGGRRTWFELDVRGGESGSLALPAADANKSGETTLSQQWHVGGPYYDLDGDGTLTRITPSSLYKVGDFRHDWPGLEMVQFESLTSASAATHRESTGALLRRLGGQWVEAWHSPPLADLYSPLPIVADFDADGRLDVAVLGLRNVFVLDLADGHLKATVEFMVPGATGRGYGWFGAQDLDHDGLSELVVMGDFENFICVLSWRGGRLHKVWDRLIEPGISNKQTNHHPGVSPLRDIDGDGRAEVVTTIFNERHDNRWHTVAYAGLTGEVILDVPGYFLSGMDDVNGDGATDLLLTAVTGQRLPEKAKVKVLSFAGRTQSGLWKQTGVEFETSEVEDFRLQENSVAGSGRQTALSGGIDGSGRPAWITRRVTDSRSGTVELSVWQAKSNGSVARIGLVKGPNLEGLRLRAASGNAAELLVQSETAVGAAGLLTTNGLLGTVGLSRAIGAPRSSAVVGRLHGSDRPTLVVQGAAETIYALTAADQATQVAWVHAGRGVFTGSDSLTGQRGFGGLVLADLMGDGNLATLLATRGDDGQARLAAVRWDGSEIWRADFDRFPGAPPQWNQGGLTTWIAGRFRSPDRDDVLVSMRRGTMHSDELVLLDGKTGRVVWSRTWGNTPGTPPEQRGAGETWMATLDWDGDGLDEAINLYPDVFYVVDGNGTNLADRSFVDGVFGPGAALYGLPVVDDFLGNGRPTILYGASSYKLGLLDQEARQLWAGPWQDGTPGILPGIGDLDGDGDLELVSPGHHAGQSQSAEELHVYDAASGSLAGTLPLPGDPFTANGGFLTRSPSTPAVGDLNGDGRDEAVFSIGDTLYAVGQNDARTAVEVRWTQRLAGNLGPPILVDAAGHGRLQIVVVSDNGNVYGVGSGFTPHETGAFYLSTKSAATLTSSNEAQLAVSGADVVQLTLLDDGSYHYDPFFRGSAVGLEANSESVDAFDVLPDRSLLLSTSGAAGVHARYDAGVGSGAILTAAGEDLLRFVPDRAEDMTTGTWSVALDGSQVDLAGKSENIDAVAELADGRIVISTVGSFSLPDNVQGQSNDLAAWSPDTDTWAVYFDGGDVGLSGRSEDIVGLAIGTGDDGKLEMLLVTRGNFSVAGASGANEDAVRFRPTSLGASTAGAFDSVLALDGSQYGLAALALDGIDWAPLAAALQKTSDAAAARVWGNDWIGDAADPNASAIETPLDDASLVPRRRLK